MHKTISYINRAYFTFYEPQLRDKNGFEVIRNAVDRDRNGYTIPLYQLLIGDGYLIIIFIK